MPEEVATENVPEGGEEVEVYDLVDPAQVGDDVAFIVKESKAGYKTTEFWITIITSLAVVFNGIPAPESKEGYIVAAVAAVYAISRGLAKNKVPNTEAEVRV